MARRVLIVDDEESILRTTALLLEDFGFEVHMVERADRVVPTALDVRPDVLLQDVRMPGLNIDRLVQDLRAHEALRDVHIVLFTAGMEAEDIASRIGVQVLEKPFRPSDLLAAVG